MKFGMLMAMAGLLATGSNPISSRFDQPVIEMEEPYLRGKFTGKVPKGCKVATVPIEVKWQGYHLTQNVDIVYGSEKAKQKAIIKAEHEVRAYLSHRPRYMGKEFSEFDIVELGHL